MRHATTQEGHRGSFLGTFEELIPSERHQILGGFNPEPAARHDDTARFTRLTDRELEVFEMIGRGAGTREIAAYLNRSVSAIETCRVSIKEKLQLRNCSDLVCRAVRWADCQKNMAG